MKKPVVQIFSELEMLGFIKTNGTQCRFVSLISKTPVKLKKGNPWKSSVKEPTVFKVSKKIGIVNANYNTSVRRRLSEKNETELKETEYQNGEVWYEHLKTSDGKDLPVVQHKNPEKQGDFYLQYYPHKTNSFYVDVNNNKIDQKEVEQWAYKKSERPDWKPNVIAVNMKNIQQLKASGVVMDMPGEQEIEEMFV